MTPGIITIEPHGGDYVAYIDAMVGPPPEDPETAAKLISEQLAERSRHNIEIMNSLSKEGAAALKEARAAAPLGTGWGHGVQPAAGAARSRLQGGAAVAGRSVVATLVAGIARLMTFAGVGWLAAAILMSEQWPWMSPVPGVALLFLGVMIGNVAGGSRRKAAAP